MNTGQYNDIILLQPSVSIRTEIGSIRKLYWPISRVGHCCMISRLYKCGKLY